VTTADLGSDPKRRNWYEKHVSRLDPLFQVLSVKNMPRGAMTGLAVQSGINLRTLEGWRSHLKKNPSWRPSRCHNRRRVFDDGEEADIANDRVFHHFLASRHGKMIRQNLAQGW
jgi:hypothetical protein